jgi:hypothetical protein
MACFFQWRICAGSNAALLFNNVMLLSAETDRLHF